MSTCVVCQRPERAVTDSQVCPPCQTGIAHRLRDIPNQCDRLDTTPGQGGGSTRPAGKPGSRPPIAIDPLDLTMPARGGDLSPIGKQLARDYGDQIGELPVAFVLDQWVQIWREHLWPNSWNPPSTVPALAGWLLTRLGDACDKHPAIDEFADVIAKLHNTLRRATGDFPARPERLDVPCRSRDCNQLGLFRHAGSDYPIRCHLCGDLMTEDEYARWTKLVAASTKEVTVS